MAEIVIKLVNGELAGKTAQQINKEYAAASLAVKKLEVGTKDWIAATQRLDKAKQMQADYNTQLNATGKASDLLKKSWNSLPGAGFFNQIGQSLSSAKPGVGGLVSGMGVLKGAIAATGIGLLVLAVGALVTWFTKTETGGDLVAKTMAALGNVFRQVTESIDRLVKGDFIGFFKGMTTEMVQTTNAAWSLADVLDALEEKESAFQVVKKAGLRDKAELLKMTKEENISLTDRIKAIDKARAISKTLNDQELDFARERIKVILNDADITDAVLDNQIKKLEETGITFENAQKIFKKNGLTQADLDEANKAMAGFLEIQQGAFDEERELLERRNKLSHKEERANTADVKQQLKEQEQARKEARQMELVKQREMAELQKQAWKEYYDSIKILEDGKVQLMGESRERDQAELTLSLRHQIEALDSNAPFYAERLAQAQNLARQKRKEINDKWDAKDIEDKLMHAELEQATDQNLLNQRYLNRDITEAQFRELSFQALLTAEQNKLAIIRQLHGEESAEYQAQYSKVLGLQQAYADQQIKTEEELNKQRLQAVNNGLSTFGNAFGQLASMHEQGTAEWKRWATAQAIVSAIQGSINAYSSASAVNPVLGPIAAGIALAAGLKSVQKIKETKVSSPVKKAELGGYLNGPRHSQGGINIEAEGGEFIFSRKAVAGLGVDNLARMNGMFAAGGPVNPFESGRFAAAASAQTGGSQGMLVDFSPVIVEIRNLVAAMDRRIDRLEVRNDLTKTKKGLETLNQLKDDADV